MKFPCQRCGKEWRRAFTRIEVVAVVLVVGMLMCLIVPLKADASRRRAQQMMCLSNLQQVGRAYHAWAMDNGDRLPVQVRTNEGGMYQHQLSGNAWFHFYSLSNELSSPRVLVCPADALQPVRRVATNFSNQGPGGLASAANRNNSVSYIVDTDTVFQAPRIFISGDRDLQTPSTSGCTALPAGVVASAFSPTTLRFWTNGIHMNNGNLLYTDGSAAEATTADFVKSIRADYNGSIHVLIP